MQEGDLGGSVVAAFVEAENQMGLRAASWEKVNVCEQDLVCGEMARRKVAAGHCVERVHAWDAYAQGHRSHFVDWQGR